MPSSALKEEALISMWTGELFQKKANADPSSVSAGMRSPVNECTKTTHLSSCVEDWIFSKWSEMHKHIEIWNQYWKQSYANLSACRKASSNMRQCVKQAASKISGSINFEILITKRIKIKQKSNWLNFRIILQPHLLYNTWNARVVCCQMDICDTKRMKPA